MTLIKSKATGHIYQYVGKNETESSLVNLTTGNSCVIENEKMKSLFVIPLTLNQMVEKNDNVVELIKILNLSYDN